MKRAMNLEQAVSVQNPRVKLAASLKQRKYRERHGLVLVEGVRLIQQAIAFGAEFAYFLAHLESAGGEALAAIRATGAPVLPVNDDGLRKVSDAATPQGVIGVAKAVPAERSLIERAEWILVADRLRDPGNLGALVRIGAAAHVDGIVSTAGSVDFGHPRAIRASAGGYFALPHLDGPEPGECAAALARSGWRVIVADAGAEKDVFDFDWSGRIALVIGNEAEGPDAAFFAAGERVRIPMPGGIESLNAAVAAGIIVYEALRARR